MSIEIDYDISHKFWHDAVQESAEGTFFHTPAWADLVTAVETGYTADAVFARAPSGAGLLLPLVCIERDERTGACVYEAMPYFTYGGPLIEEGLDLAEVPAMVEAICKSRPLRAYSVTIHGNPYLGASYQRTKRDHRNFTQVVDLEGGMDAVRGKYASHQRRALRKAVRNGLRARRGRSLSDWQSYFEIYEKSLIRWQDNVTSRYPWRLFQKLKDLGTKQAQLWLVEKDGNLCSGAVVFYHGKRAFYWHGAADEGYFGLYPNNYLHDVIMADACDRKVRVYDMLSSGGHEGVERFKERFGARRVPFEGFYWKSGVYARLERYTRRVMHGLSRARRNREGAKAIIGGGGG